MGTRELLIFLHFQVMEIIFLYYCLMIITFKMSNQKAACGFLIGSSDLLAF